MSSAAWLRRQRVDPYVAERNLLGARSPPGLITACDGCNGPANSHAGLRSRAAFKLREIDDKFTFLRRARAVVDLGCAPGGFLQVAHARMKHGLVVGVDLLPVEPVGASVHVVRGDFTAQATVDAVLERVGALPLDGVLCDMAPNTAGDPFVDGAKQLRLARLAWAFASKHLAPGGFFVCKLFANGEEKHFADALKARFGVVRFVKVGQRSLARGRN